MARTASTNDGLIAIGDIHAPYQCSSTLAKIIAVIEKLQPRFIVQVGDLRDLYSFSRYGKSANLTTPVRELTDGSDVAQTFWSAVVKASPASKKYQLRGNHDDRLYKKIAEKMPELVGIVDADSLFTFKGVESMKSERDVLEITVQGAPWAVSHGFLSKIGDHVKYFQKSTIIGHSHRAHCVPFKIHDRVMWELNCGYAADPTAEVFKYGQTVKNHWTRGYGLIDSLGPRFVSLEDA